MKDAEVQLGDSLKLLAELPAESVDMVFCDPPYGLNFLHSQPGELVLDCFAGSGSTGEAAIRLGRRFLGMEIDPQFYAMAEARIRRAIPTPELAFS